MNYIFGYEISDSQYPQMKIIETPKFILRPASLSDMSDFFEYLSQEKVVRYLPFKAHQNPSETQKFIQTFFINNYKKGRVGNYAIYHKGDKKVIGNIGINNVSISSQEGEMGISLNPLYWGNDYATELTIITLITGFELMNLNKLIALTYSANKYTPKSLENLGFKYIKTYRPNNSGPLCHRFELNKSEYYMLKQEYLPNLVNSFY